MAEATQEVAHGNFDHRVAIQAQDELGTLVTSFNEMTAQLGEGRRQINEFTRNLQQAFEERDRRRKLMEAVENIPTGVLSLDAEGGISRVNSAVVAIFGEHAREARTAFHCLVPNPERSCESVFQDFALCIECLLGRWRNLSFANPTSGSALTRPRCENLR